jgi:hypothetical protein
VVLAMRKPTISNLARAYKPNISSEDYASESIQNLRKSGVNIDIRALVKRLMEAEGE